MKTIVKHCPHLVSLVLANCPLITDVAMSEIATNLSAVRYVVLFRASIDETRRDDNYFLLKTVCRRQQKKHRLWGKLSTTKCKKFKLSTTRSFVVKKGNSLDNKLLSTTSNLTAFCRLWVRII